MREILFRGKRADGGGWVVGEFSKPSNILTVEREFDPVTQEEDDVFNDYLCLPETIGQFTGLCDKNGNKVFEGDILYWATDLDGNGVLTEEHLTVYWDSQLAGFQLKSDISEFPCEIEGSNELEIVGNIFDGVADNK